MHDAHEKFAVSHEWLRIFNGAPIKNMYIEHWNRKSHNIQIQIYKNKKMSSE